MKRDIMKTDLMRGLGRSRRTFESDSFLKDLLKGGYELKARNTIQKNLPREKDFRREVKIPNTNKIADLVLCPEFEIADFGHNGTWQTQTRNTGLVNKVKSDIKKYINEPEVPVVYIVGFLTDIISINDDYIDLMSGYVDAKKNLTRATANKRVELVIRELDKIDSKSGNELGHEVFTNTSEGFEIDIHVFVLGPFVDE